MMTHGDDDGLRVPPRIAPFQIVILPMLRDKPEDEDVLAYCEELNASLTGLSTMGEPLRILFDKSPAKRQQSVGIGSEKARQSWLKSGRAIWRTAR